MGVEDININTPAGTDPISQGDDELRQLKTDITESFTNMDGAWTTSSAASFGGISGTNLKIETPAFAGITINQLDGANNSAGITYQDGGLNVFAFNYSYVNDRMALNVYDALGAFQYSPMQAGRDAAASFRDIDNNLRLEVLDTGARVTGDLELTGEIVGTWQAPIAMGRVNSSGTPVGTQTGASVARTSDGTYRVTLDAPATSDDDISVSLTYHEPGTGTSPASYLVIDASTFDVFTRGGGGALADRDFSFEVYDRGL
jgi:hypothetical protein